MVWHKVQYRVTGSAPLIMHNGQTADPLNPISRAKGKISGKRKKTDADHEELARLDFMGGLYMGEDGPVLPAHVIEATVQAAARRFNEGQLARSGCFCSEHSNLEYEGPRTVEELWNDAVFRFSIPVRQQQNRIPRMRPIFREWAATITLNVEDTIINLGRVDEWLLKAGTEVGMCDWRPKYGRFTAKRLNGK